MRNLAVDVNQNRQTAYAPYFPTLARRSTIGNVRAQQIVGSRWDDVSHNLSTACCLSPSFIACHLSLSLLRLVYRLSLIPRR